MSFSFGSFGQAPSFGQQTAQFPTPPNPFTTSTLFPTRNGTVTWQGNTDVVGRRSGHGELVDTINNIVSRGQMRDGVPVGRWIVYRQGRITNVVEYDNAGAVVQITEMPGNGGSYIVFPTPPPQPPITFGFQTGQTAFTATPGQ